MMSARRRWMRRGAVCAGVVCVLCAMLVARVHEQGRQELVRSDSAFDAGQLDAALDHARQAALWYLPSAPHVQSAHERIRAIAVGAEATGQADLALRGWETLRGVLHETAHPWSEEHLRLHEANSNVVRLLVGSTGGELPELERQYRQTSSALGVYVAATTLGALALLVAAAVLLGGTAASSLRRWGVSGVVFALGLSLWLLAALGA